MPTNSLVCLSSQHAAGSSGQLRGFNSILRLCHSAACCPGLAEKLGLHTTVLLRPTSEHVQQVGAHELASTMLKHPGLRAVTLASAFCSEEGSSPAPLSQWDEQPTSLPEVDGHCAVAAAPLSSTVATPAVKPANQADSTRSADPQSVCRPTAKRKAPETESAVRPDSDQDRKSESPTASAGQLPSNSAPHSKAGYHRGNGLDAHQQVLSTSEPSKKPRKQNKEGQEQQRQEPSSAPDEGSRQQPQRTGSSPRHAAKASKHVTAPHEQSGDIREHDVQRKESPHAPAEGSKPQTKHPHHTSVRQDQQPETVNQAAVATCTQHSGAGVPFGPTRQAGQPPPDHHP